MTNQDWLAAQFEENRPRLRAIAYRMLGSLSEGDDAVQDAWLRLSQSDVGRIKNLGGWLTTVVARVCLNMLRSRRSRREEAFGPALPDPVVSRADSLDPEQAVLLADSVGLALLVILEALSPDERLAFVLHDMFAVPFDEIGPIVGRSPTAARQLASRARRRVQGSVSRPELDLSVQRDVAAAFLGAVRAGDFDALLAVLDPDVVLRADRGAVPSGNLRVLRGSRAVAEGARAYAHLAALARPVLVNGAAGFVAVDGRGQIHSVMGLIVAGGRIVEIDILADPARLRRLDLSAFE